MKQICYISMMRIPNILILALVVASAVSLRVLKGDQIPKDYPIGSILHMDFTSDGRLFFRANDNVLGFINGKTGVITTLFELEKDESIVDYRGMQEVVIYQNKSLYLLRALDDKFIKIHTSEFLEKQTFKQVIAFKRYFTSNYVLTDTFLLKAHNPESPYYNPSDEDTKQKYKIMATTEKDETFFQLIFIGHQDPDKTGIGLVSMSKADDKKEICIREYMTNGEFIKKMCYQLDQSLQFDNVFDLGDNILIAYRTKQIILDTNMKRLKQVSEKAQITFITQLNILEESAEGKNLNSDDKSKTMIFFDFGKRNSPQTNNVQIFDKYMLVKDKGKVIVNIPKKDTEVPVHIWAHTFQPDSPAFTMIVSFGNGRVAAFNINSKKKDFSIIWDITVSQFKEIEGGKKQEAEMIKLNDEQKMIEDGQNNQEEILDRQEEKNQQDLAQNKPEGNSPSTKPVGPERVPGDVKDNN